MPDRSYNDADLGRAIAESRSWRGVLRSLGLSATSAAAIRSVRRRAQQLDLDASHFTGQRRWTERQLADAVAASHSWTEVLDALGLSGGSSTSTLKGYALRLQLDTTHFAGAPIRRGEDPPVPLLAGLPRAGSLLAASWFALVGYDVSWPLEPCAYDLLAHRGEEFLRVQVKTTRRWAEGSWIVRISSHAPGALPYDPDDVDCFFVVDGDLAYYLIPFSVVGGVRDLSLNAYRSFQVQRDPITRSPEVP